MLTRQDKKKLRLKALNLKKNEHAFRDHYKRDDPTNNTTTEKDNQGYGYLQLGFEFVISLFLFLFGGYALDKAISTKPLFLFLGLVIGFSVGLYRLIDATKHEK